MTTKLISGFSATKLPVLAIAFLAPGVLWAQSGPTDTPGINSGDYNIHQTIEAGYRANFVNGNKDTYDTFENLGSASVTSTNISIQSTVPTAFYRLRHP